MLEKIGKYEIRLQIGRGAMGTVYEGFDPSIGRRVAIKTLRTEMFEPRQLADVLVRFKREAQSAGRLSHPHIVTIHELGEEQSTPYIVMEYVSGNELGHRLESGARFTLDEVVRIMTQLLGALTHAHEHGVVHRDLKPANMFLLEDGSLKVVDFGIARIESSDLTDTGAMLGTPAYMSPEQCLGLQVDHRSDLFSASVILYQLLTGDKPFTGSVTTTIQKVLRQEPIAPSELNPTLSPAWDKVVARAMAKKPEARYASARQFAEAIKAAFIAEHAHEDEGRRKAAEAEERTIAIAKSARSRAPAIAVAIVVAAGAIGAVLYIRQGAEDQASKADAARVAAEAGMGEETGKRTKVEARARDEAELAAKAGAEEEAKKAVEEKTKALVLKNEEDEKRKTELAAKKEAEAKAKVEAARKAEEARRAVQRPGTVFQDCPECPRMVVIPAGEFTMGSAVSETWREADEGPERRVRFGRPFAIGRSEVTQGEWRAVMDTNTSNYFSTCGDDCPVERVNWNEAREFVRRLAERTGKPYRLPSEAEWEYACRANGAGPYCGGADAGSVAWHNANSGGRTQRAGQKQPNAFGLYDMSGNVWEWTQDCWNANYSSAPTDGSAWLSGDCSQRAIRGGSWEVEPRSVRSANRGGIASDRRWGGLGFRLARTLE